MVRGEEQPAIVHKLLLMNGQRMRTHRDESSRGHIFGLPSGVTERSIERRLSNSTPMREDDMHDQDRDRDRDRDNVQGFAYCPGAAHCRRRLQRTAVLSNSLTAFDSRECFSVAAGLI